MRGVQRAIFQVALGYSRVTAGTQPAPQTDIWTEDPAGLKETWGRCLLWLFVLGALGSRGQGAVRVTGCPRTLALMSPRGSLFPRAELSWLFPVRKDPGTPSGHSGGGQQVSPSTHPTCCEHVIH